MHQARNEFQYQTNPAMRAMVEEAAEEGLTNKVVAVLEEKAFEVTTILSDRFVVKITPLDSDKDKQVLILPL